MRTLDLARKDFIQIFRDKMALFFLVIMPIAFTLFFGFVMGGSSTTQADDPRLKIGVLNQDSNGVLSQALVDLLSASDVARPVVLDPSQPVDLDEMVRGGELSAVITLPLGFSSDTLAGTPPQTSVIVDANTETGQTASRALQTAITRLMSTAYTARSSADAFASQVGFRDESARQQYLAEAVVLAVQAWQSPAVTVRLTGPVLEPGEPKAPANPYNQFSPGMMVMFAVFGLNQIALVLVLERKNGALSRLLTTPLRRIELIGGHLLAMFVVVFAQQLLLVIFGQIVLNVNYLREPLAILLVLAALSIWVAALGLLIGALVQQEEKVVVWCMAAMFISAGLGGAWFPLDVAGKAFSTVGHFMPTAWAMDGLQNIIMRGLGVGSVLLPVAIILAYALAFFSLAVWKFKFE